MRPPPSPLPAGLFEEHRGFLWGLAYRLTGNAADADDVVQETFLRAMTRPPADRARPWRPWLVRVALNLGRDLLRRRRRRGYDGPWLPSVIEAEPPAHEPVDPLGNPAARYDLMQSVSFAFLLALERLSPLQRAALVLRDVFDYSARETARALSVTEAGARQAHLRARRALSAYDASRPPSGAEGRERARAALERFLACVAAGDTAGVEALLSEDVRALSDAGGEFHANRVPVVGRRKVAALFLGLARGLGRLERAELRTLNGAPAFYAERAARAGFAPRWAMLVEAGEDGRLRRFYTVLAREKLAAIR